MASVFKACQQSVTSHGEFIMARVVKLFIRPAVNNEPCQLIGDSTSPSQTAEKKPKEVTINGNAPFGLCVLPNTPQKTTISLFFFFLPSFLFPPFRHVMLAHFHPLAVSAGSSYQARFKQLEGKETHFHSPVFISFMCKFTSHSSNNWKINI